MSDEFQYRTQLDEINKLRAENGRLSTDRDYWMVVAIAWAGQASLSGGSSHDFARDRYRRVFNQNKVFRAALEDAVETLEAMGAHLGNPLYDRLWDALEVGK